MLSTNEKLLSYLMEFICCEFGVFSVFILSKYAAFNGVFAVSSTTLVVGLLFPKQAIIFLCGGFASVMNTETLNNPGFLAFSGSLAFLFYRLTLKLFLNIGGRPGTIAFISNLITFLLVYLISLSKSYNYYPMDFVVDLKYFEALNIYIYRRVFPCRILNSFNCNNASNSRIRNTVHGRMHVLFDFYS